MTNSTPGKVTKHTNNVCILILLFLCFAFVFFRQGLAMQTGCVDHASDSQRSDCLSLPNEGIKGRPHDTW